MSDVPFTTDELNRALDDALKRGVVSDGWGDDSDDPASTPQSTSDPSEADPQVTVPAGEEPANGTDTPDTDASTPGASTEPSSAPTEPDGADFQLEIAGRRFQRQHIEQLVQLGDYFASITPEQAEAIDAIVQGRTPTAPPPTVTTPQSQPQPSPAAQADDDDMLDPVAAERLRALQAEIEALKAQTTGVMQSQTEIERERVARETAEHVRIQDEQLADLMQSRGLDPAEKQRIIDVTAASGLIPQLVQRYGRDNPARVYREAFEQAMWLDPTLRDRLIAAEREAAVRKATNDEARANNSGVAPSGGSISRSASRPKVDPSAPLGEHISALAKELEPFMQR